jgi:hypothetical protein
VANGHGGKRPGAGRKPKVVKEIERKAIAGAGPDAEYALGLHVSVMRDDDADERLRLQCGQVVMDRVWGKPQQKMDVTSDGKGFSDSMIEIVEHGTGQAA